MYETVLGIISWWNEREREDYIANKCSVVLTDAWMVLFVCVFCVELYVMKVLQHHVSLQPLSRNICIYDFPIFTSSSRVAFIGAGTKNMKDIYDNSLHEIKISSFDSPLTETRSSPLFLSFLTRQSCWRSIVRALILTRLTSEESSDTVS